jgi:hypothetical protein
MSCSELSQGSSQMYGGLLTEDCTKAATICTVTHVSSANEHNEGSLSRVVLAALCVLCLS